jgi:hypothetical protein
MVSIVSAMARTPEVDDEDSEDVASITVRFPLSIRDGLKKCAKAEERAFNTVVVRACRAYLEQHIDEIGIKGTLGTFKRKI